MTHNTTIYVHNAHSCFNNHYTLIHNNNNYNTDSTFLTKMAEEKVGTQLRTKNGLSY